MLGVALFTQVQSKETWRKTKRGTADASHRGREKNREAKKMKKRPRSCNSNECLFFLLRSEAVMGVCLEPGREKVRRGVNLR